MFKWGKGGCGPLYSDSTIEPYKWILEVTEPPFKQRVHYGDTIEGAGPLDIAL